MMISFTRGYMKYKYSTGSTQKALIFQNYCLHLQFHTQPNLFHDANALKTKMINYVPWRRILPNYCTQMLPFSSFPSFMSEPLSHNPLLSSPKCPQFLSGKLLSAGTLSSTYVLQTLLSSQARVYPHLLSYFIRVFTQVLPFCVSNIHRHTSASVNSRIEHFGLRVLVLYSCVHCLKHESI